MDTDVSIGEGVARLLVGSWSVTWLAVAMRGRTPTLVHEHDRRCHSRADPARSQGADPDTGEVGGGDGRGDPLRGGRHHRVARHRRERRHHRDAHRAGELPLSVPDRATPPDGVPCRGGPFPEGAHRLGRTPVDQRAGRAPSLVRFRSPRGGLFHDLVWHGIRGPWCSPRISCAVSVELSVTDESECNTPGGRQFAHRAGGVGSRSTTCSRMLKDTPRSHGRCGPE